jgi:hypothetical protein
MGLSGAISEENPDPSAGSDHETAGTTRARMIIAAIVTVFLLFISILLDI